MRGLRVVVAVQRDAPRTLPRQGKLAPSPCCKWSGAVPRVWEWSVGTLCGAAVAVRIASGKDEQRAPALGWPPSTCGRRCSLKAAIRRRNRLAVVRLGDVRRRRSEGRQPCTPTVHGSGRDHQFHSLSAHLVAASDEQSTILRPVALAKTRSNEKRKKIPQLLHSGKPAS